MANTDAVTTEPTTHGEVVAQRRPGAITADVNYDESGVIIAHGVHIAAPHIRGAVTFETCDTPECPLTITSLRLYADDFEMRDTAVSGFAIWNHGPIVGVPAGNGTYSISGQSWFDVAGVVDGDATGLSTQPGSVALAAFDGRRLGLAFSIETNDTIVVVKVIATAHDLPPRAHISAPGTIECVASNDTPAVLDASGSTDADGDIAGYLWTVNGRVIAFGPEAIQTVHLPVGRSRASVTVFDSRGATSTAGTSVVVEDTTPPEVSVSADVCIWPPSHDMRLFTPQELGLVVSDACDPLPSVSILDVANLTDPAHGEGSTAPDEALGTGAFCVRSERSGLVNEGRTYAVHVLGRDAACNENVALLHVYVPHDLGATSCPANGRAGGAIVPDGSTSCVAAGPSSTCSTP